MHILYPIFSRSSDQVKVFKPFFVSLTLPYSVIRGEKLVLQATIFNYMASPVQVWRMLYILGCVLVVVENQTYTPSTQCFHIGNFKFPQEVSILVCCYLSQNGGDY